MYADEASVPAIELPSMRLRFSAPWGFSDRRNLAEGETLDIPVHYEVRNPDASADYRITMTLLFGNFGASLGPQARAERASAVRRSGDGSRHGAPRGRRVFPTK